MGYESIQSGEIEKLARSIPVVRKGAGEAPGLRLIPDLRPEARL
jgi:hypothetical protein